MAAQTFADELSLLIPTPSVILFGIQQEQKADQKLQKEAQVTLYRSYRVGDFPDIQIPYSNLITPLQALAQVNTATSCCKYPITRKQKL